MKRQQEINPARRVITLFGGITDMSRATGIPVTTIQSWGNAGSIHQRNWLVILAAAEKADIKLTYRDFVELPEEPETAEDAATA